MEEIRDMINEAFDETNRCEVTHRQCSTLGEYYVTSHCSSCETDECILVCDVIAVDVMNMCNEDQTIKCSSCHHISEAVNFVRSVDERGATL